MSHLLAHLAKDCQVSLLTFESSDTVSFYPLPSSVVYLRGNKLGGTGLNRLWRILSRLSLIRQTVQNCAPDVIISFMDTANVTTLLACSGRGVPVIVSERVDPSQHNIGWARRLLRTYTYPLARLIVVPSRRVADYFPASLQSKIRIIGNPVPIPPVRARVGESPGRKRVIAVGRYELQKGFDLLLDAFALVAGEHPDWDLVVIGDGPERPRLERRVQDLDLEERITLKGVVSNILQELASCHLMAFPSRYEGFPNALAEGLAAGLPAVGFKAVSGVEELILDGQTGLLVDQQEGAQGLADAIASLLVDEKMRRQLGDAAYEHVRRWAPDRIFSLWKEALREAGGSPDA
jgi:glycosyltransferase involved in cell wall biosynthesis